MWFTNPFSSPYFPEAVYTLGGLLGFTLLALLAMARFSVTRLREGVLFKRWLVWAWIAPIYTVAVLSGRAPALVLFAAMGFQCAREYATLVGLPTPYRYSFFAATLATWPAAAISDTSFYILPPLLLVAGTLQPLLFGNVRDGVRHLAFGALGWGYAAWLPAHLLLMQRQFDGGPGLLLVVGLAVALSDVSAFTVGKRFGRRKLAPRVSPNKTVEGVAGNVVGAGLGVGLMWFAVPGWLPLAAAVGLPFVVAAGAVWGDLFESAIKREFGAKDAGTWLPGFGGLLDRVDSLILAAPLVYYLLRLSGE